MSIRTTRGGDMSANAAVDHYEILGVPEHADTQAIEAAYRAGLAKIKASLGGGNPLPADFFERLREAYRTLADAERRQAYDLERLPQPGRLEPTLGDATVTAPDEPLRFQFSGTGGDYFRIWIVNLVLSVLTLGIYSAWAKVRREQFFHRNTLLAGSGFDYHGNPKAILKGRLIAWTLFGLMGASQKFSPMLYGILVLCSIPILPWLLMRSLKFRAANTSYRGLRFHHRGTYGGAFVAFVVQGLPVLIGGLWLPMWMRAIKRFQLDKLSFGRTEFKCTPSASGFFGAYFKAGLLVVVPFFVLMLLIGSKMSSGSEMGGIMMVGAYLLVFSLVARPYIQARLANLTWNATSVGGKTFISTQTFRSYLAVVVGNFVLIVLTLGLYWPWAKVREAAYRLDRLQLEATNLDAFAGLARTDNAAAGEEIADAFDLDFSL
ncbi:MAG: DUF898 family protein [Rhodocyclales bacterium]|nr:DUF898 family protein [Rhodocyclales bacterium]